MVKIAKRHPLYKEHEAQWRRMRDVLGGSDRVKAAGEKYLPRLGGQTQLDPSSDTEIVITSYESYKFRAVFLEATSRTSEALAGMIRRKKEEVIWPTTEAKILERAGRGLESFSELATQAVEEMLGIGWFGHLVDMGKNGGRPFVATYKGETITDWAEDVVDDRVIPVRVHLCERTSEFVNNERTEVTRYRVLRLGIPTSPREGETTEEFFARLEVGEDEVEQGAFYFQEIWKERVLAPDQAVADEEREYDLVEVIVPRAQGGGVLREIPFTFFTPFGPRPRPQCPLLNGIAVLNLGHYRNSADHEHGLHFTALPQPWVAGFKFKNTIYIGSGAAWVTDNPQAKAGYLEFTGQGLGAIREEMERKKREMASLGARVLEEQVRSGAGEAAETVKLRQAGETSILSKVSQNTSAGLTSTLRHLAAFLRVKDDVSVKLNMDFGLDTMSPEMLTALFAAMIGGGISWNTFFWNVKRGELVEEGVDANAESERIRAGTPIPIKTEPTAPSEPKKDETGEAA